MPEVSCTVADLNQKRIDAWNSANLPIYEPNLDEVVKLARDGSPDGRKANLIFTSDIDRAIAEADIVFVSVNTPTKLTGTGAGRASDLGFVESATRMIAEVSTTDKIVVEKSTVPCRTAESIRDILSANGKPGVHFDVLSNPEFLAEGTAVTDLQSPDRILIGSLPGYDGDRAAAALVDLYAQWVPRDRIITMNLWSSELAKLAANAMLAQRISSVNALSAICEATGAEIDEVSYAVGRDKRIGPYMLKSSVGFGGSCYKKDIFNLVYLCESLHLPEVAAYWKSVVDINEWQKDRFTKRVVSCLYNTLSNKKVTILGFAYKKNTGDTRESAAITIVNSLVAERAHVAIYDPQVKEDHIWQDLYMTNDNKKALDDCVTVNNDAYEACKGSSAVVIVTEWDEFKCDTLPARSTPSMEKLRQDTNGLSITPISKEPLADKANVSAAAARSLHVPSKTMNPNKSRLDWPRIAKLMNKPMFVFDGRNIVDGARLHSLGFRVECIGNAKFSGR